MKPLWRLRSGRFAGWNRNGQLFDSAGKHVGYFRGDLAIGRNGRVVGKMYNDKFIGYRLGIAYSIHSCGGSYAGIAAAPYAGYCGMAIAGWEDPHF